MSEQQGGQWLPPDGAVEQPAGGPPAQPPQPPPPQAPPPQQPPQAPPPPQPGAWPPQQPSQPPPGWQPPQQPGYYQPWQHLQPRPDEPGNGPAVTGFVLSLSGLGLLVVSFGLLFIVCLPCSILGIVFGRKGKKKIEAGETRKHQGLSQAAFIIGIVGTVLSVLSAAGWILLLALDGSVLDDLDDPNNEFDFSSAARVIGAALRAVF